MKDFSRVRGVGEAAGARVQVVVGVVQVAQLLLLRETCGRLWVTVPRQQPSIDLGSTLPRNAVEDVQLLAHGAYDGGDAAFGDVGIFRQDGLRLLGKVREGIHVQPGEIPFK